MRVKRKRTAPNLGFHGRKIHRELKRGGILLGLNFMTTAAGEVAVCCSKQTKKMKMKKKKKKMMMKTKGKRKTLAKKRKL